MSNTYLEAEPLRGVGFGPARHMLIDKEFRELVGYLAYDETDGGKVYRTPGATVFFLQLEALDKSSVIYAVTARHCIHKRFRRFYIRAKGMDDLETRREDWIFHPDTDIAVCWIKEPIQPTTVIMSEAHPIEWVSRCGHEIFSVGLFDPLPGTDGIEPVVRFGHIALHDTQAPIILDLSKPKEQTVVDAHLIETRSWGGESGAPVFAHSQYYREPFRPLFVGDYYTGGQAKPSEVSALETDCTFLGLLHGHFEVERPQQHKRYDKQGRIADVNAGIAVVIPARKIWEFLMKDAKLVGDRQSVKRKAETPIPDAKIPATFTKADFEDALKKVSRKIKPKKP